MWFCVKEAKYSGLFANKSQHYRPPTGHPSLFFKTWEGTNIWSEIDRNEGKYFKIIDGKKFIIIAAVSYVYV